MGNQGAVTLLRKHCHLLWLYNWEYSYIFIFLFFYGCILFKLGHYSWDKEQKFKTQFLTIANWVKTYGSTHTKSITQLFNMSFS